MTVLYEDNHLIAVYKPAGVLVQGDANESKCLLEDVRAYLKEKYQKPGNVFVGLLHRIDRNVSGIVLFAKTSKGASRVSEQIRNHTMIKKYHALVEGRLDSTHGTIKTKLDKDERTMKAVISPTGKEAVLSYEVVKEIDGNTLVHILLETGRFHQIRAQFASIGHPLVGDIKYGAHSPLPDHGIALCATSLEFKKAVGDEVVKLEIEVPRWGAT